MRTHRAARGRRAGGALAHLLLVVVLALGVFLMHAVGHPEGSGGGADTVSASSGGTKPPDPAASGRSHSAGLADSGGAHRMDPVLYDEVHATNPGASGGSHVTHAAASHGADGSDARHQPGAGMDMTTLCVAVLGAWLLAGLVRAALGRRPEWLTLLLARLTPALGPHAPPRRPPDLARLSVLRI
ncbi:hypothetical protein ACFVZH_01695 [Streptomyces sp. NPDC059534]|uniref:hypothetical protein n=1 Tax=Streptomyces sp. NPDC059534 TaxID=3346859 RepID=UPI0036B6E0B7